MKKLLIGLAVFISSNAYSFNGEEMLLACENANKDNHVSYTGGFCMGYIESMRNYGVVFLKLLSEHEDNYKKICIDQTVTNGQLAAIYEKYLINNPEVWHKDAGFSLLSSFEKSFPCK